MFDTLLWDIYAWSYDSGVTHIKIYRDLLKSVINKLKTDKNDIILDLGCGTGNFEVMMEEKGLPYRKIIAVDFSEAMLKRARKKVTSKKVYFKKYDINKGIPLEDESVDKVIMIHTLYALKKPTYILKEINRVTKKGGILIIANPFDEEGGKKIKEAAFSDISFFKSVQMYLTKFPIIGINMLISKISKSGKYHFIGEKDMSKLLKDSGFKVPKTYEKTYAGTDILFITTKK